MNSNPTTEDNLNLVCPECGSRLKKMNKYTGGTASNWIDFPVSSTSGSVVASYPEQDIYVCTNPECKKLFLR